MQIIKQYSAPDGTQLIIYSDRTGYVNTMPIKIFNKKFKKLPCKQ